MSSFKRRVLDAMLLTPPGKQTRIESRHFPVINSYLSPGDRISWHRPYGLIHTAIVVSVDEENGRICVFERTKNENGLVVEPNWIKLADQAGQLYRSDEEVEKYMPFWKMLRIMLDKLGEKGYNIFGKNCQDLVAQCSRSTERFQSKWFGVNLVVHTVKGFGKSVTAEIFEALFGGAEKIGAVSVVCLQIVLFLLEFYAAYHQLKRNKISWKHFSELVIRQFSMAVFSCIGSAVGGAVAGFLLARVILWVVMSLMGAIVADFLLDLVGSDNRFVKYLGWMAGGIVGFFCTCISPGFILEILMACLLGFAGLFVGHRFGYTASWLICGPGADSRIIHNLDELRRGDHITTYEWFLHPYCHSIFIEAMPGGERMKIIRNTYRRGVVEDIVQFKAGSTYRYDYHASECHEAQVVEQKATSRLGEDNYSWFRNNCKTFAKQCKCRGEDEAVRNEPRPRLDIDWDRYFAEMISQPGLPEEKIQDLENRLQKMMHRVGCLP